MIPRLKPRYGWGEIRAAAALWRRGDVPAYEHRFAAKFGCRHGVMFAHGRSGLYALLEAWGLTGAEVICPAYTCVVVPNAVLLSGNLPVFVDCAPGDFNMDPAGIAAAVTERTRVIVATHLFGYPMDVDAVQAIADEAGRRYGHKVYVVQDCAHSYGARWKGELVTARGDAALFGSNVSKLINSIFGGMITTNDDATAEALRAWRSARLRPAGWGKELRRLIYFAAVCVAFNEWVYGLVNWLERHGAIDRFVRYYEEGKIDFPGDWDEMPAEIEARVGLAQLDRYDSILAERRRNALAIIERLKDRPGLSFAPDRPGATYSHLVALTDDRAGWLAACRAKGIQLGILIEYVVPAMAAYGSRSGFPVAESYMSRTINFPLHRAGIAGRL
jgi:perosamine synthetase